MPVQKVLEAYPPGQPPYLHQILSIVVRMRDLYAPKVLAVFVGAIPPLVISVPLLFLSAPVRFFLGKWFDNLREQ